MVITPARIFDELVPEGKYTRCNSGCHCPLGQFPRGLCSLLLFADSLQERSSALKEPPTRNSFSSGRRKKDGPTSLVR